MRLPLLVFLSFLLVTSTVSAQSCPHGWTFQNTPSGPRCSIEGQATCETSPGTSLQKVGLEWWCSGPQGQFRPECPSRDGKQLQLAPTKGTCYANVKLRCARGYEFGVVSGNTAYCVRYEPPRCGRDLVPIANRGSDYCQARDQEPECPRNAKYARDQDGNRDLCQLRSEMRF